MRRSLYIGAAVAAAPGLLAFHVPPPPAGGPRSLTGGSSWYGAGPLPTSSTRSGRSSVASSPNLSAGGLRRARRRRQARCSAPWRPVVVGSASASAGNGDGPAPGSQSSPTLQNIPHTSLVLRDEATGCDIYLVGCLHGSHASGRDVKEVLERVRPGAVVLELCESRHKSLRRDLEKEAKGDVPPEGKERWIAVFRSWAKGVKKTSDKSGPLQQAILSGLLSAPYVVQRLGDFDPGLEFKTAMLYADASCAVVLGDRDVQETLRRLGGALTALTGAGGGGGAVLGVSRDVEQVRGASAVSAFNSRFPLEPVVLSQPAVASGLGWSSLASDMGVLRMAVVGPSGREWPDSLNVFDTVWRERQALGMLLLPLLLVMTVVSEAFQRSVGGAATAAVAVSSGGGGGGTAGSGSGIFGGLAGSSSGGGGDGSAVWGGAGTGLDVGHVLEGAGNVLDTLFVGFSVWYMLRFFRLVIKERDDVLAENVLKACEDNPGRPVVAVLGLLHCNGVADLIRNSPAFEGVLGEGSKD
ncbi:unnamed protein product [Scytosiphon promiscuus]